jgi:hypothetical protein
MSRFIRLVAGTTVLAFTGSVCARAIASVREGDEQQRSSFGSCCFELHALFEPFFTTKANGMSTGLSVSRSMDQRYRGRLWASMNETGHGTTFYAAFPVTAAV